MTIRLALRKDSIQLAIQTSHASTTGMLVQNGEQLASDLAQAGAKLNAFTVT